MITRTPLFISFFLFLIITGKAQKGVFSIEAGPSAGFAIIKSQYFNTIYKPGFGGGIGALYNTTTKSAITFKFNYLSMAGKMVNTGSLNLTAVKVGYKTYFNNSTAFVFADGGVNIFSSNNGNASTSPGAGGGLGYSIAAGKKNHIDIAASFDALFGTPIHSEWLNIHVGYRINIK